MQNKKFIQAFPIDPENDAYILEDRDFYALVSKGKLESLLPKNNHPTGNYWDFFARYIQANKIESVCVVGHGLGSFIPQIPTVKVCGLERNPKVVQFLNQYTDFKNLELIQTSVPPLPDEVLENQLFIIDLSSADGISTVVLNPELYKKILSKKVLIHVYDRCDVSTPTRSSTITVLQHLKSLFAGFRVHREAQSNFIECLQTTGDKITLPSQGNSLETLHFDFQDQGLPPIEFSGLTKKFLEKILI